ADDEDLELGEAVQAQLEDRIDLNLVEAEPLHQLLCRVALPLRSTNDADRLVERIEDRDESLEDVDTLPQLLQLELEPPRDHLHPEVEEVPEKPRQVESLGGSDVRVLRGHEAGEVHLHVGL